MKFGKAFESNAEAMPEKWRLYLIRYNDFKKKINAIVQELDDRDRNSSVINSLLSPSMPDDVQRKEDSIGGKNSTALCFIHHIINSNEPQAFCLASALCSAPCTITPQDHSLLTFFFIYIVWFSFKYALEEKGHLSSCIKVVLINLEPNSQSFSQEEQLSELLVHKSASTGDLHEQMVASDVLISREIPMGIRDHRTVAVLS